jgi:hypothetical protein
MTTSTATPMSEGSEALISSAAGIAVGVGTFLLKRSLLMAFGFGGAAAIGSLLVVDQVFANGQLLAQLQGVNPQGSATQLPASTT